MKKKLIYNLISVFWALCLPLFFTACEEENVLPGVGTTRHILLNLTYDGDSTTDDNQHEGSDTKLNVADLDFLFYTTDGQFVSHASGASQVTLTPAAYDSNGHRYKADLQVEGVANNRNYRVVVLANWRDQYSGLTLNMVRPDGSSVQSLDNFLHKPANYTGTDEQYLYDNLLLAYKKSGDTYGNAISSYTQWLLSGHNALGIPVWGVQEMNVKVRANAMPETSGTINLLRSIAKVKVSISPELLQHVKVTDYKKGDAQTGLVLNYKQVQGYMTPLYSDISETKSAGLGTTWNSNGKDKVGGRFSNAHVNYASSSVSSSFSHVPMFYDQTQKAYYIYMPEQRIGESNIGIEFEWPALSTPQVPVKRNFTLHFADYDAAYAAAGSAWEGMSLPEDMLRDHMFPVMRNHYYTFTVVRLAPLMLKFEVCDWDKYRTDIYFE